ncbi:Uncharacterised protein [Vibrio cholerae]|nr:Uncharacterised protein [Vibrio cholerae]
MVGKGSLIVRTKLSPHVGRIGRSTRRSSASPKG